MPQLRSLILKLMLFPVAVVAIALMLFLPAGTLRYWQAWAFMAVLFIPPLFVLAYLLKHDPGLLERRMRFEEKEKGEKTVIRITQLLYLAGFLIPGLDYRFGWSDVPAWLVIASDAIVFIGYMLVFWVFRTNSFTSRIIEVEKKQRVISTGPYAYVRHPMYLGVITLDLFISTALGTYYALIPFGLVIVPVIYRIFDEEKMLMRDLKGYKEYCRKVRYRLIPGIW